MCPKFRVKTKEMVKIRKTAVLCQHLRNLKTIFWNMDWMNLQWVSAIQRDNLKFQTTISIENWTGPVVWNLDAFWCYEAKSLKSEQKCSDFGHFIQSEIWTLKNIKGTKSLDFRQKKSVWNLNVCVWILDTFLSTFFI